MPLPVARLQRKVHSNGEFLLNTIPSTVIEALAKEETPEALLFAILFGFARNWVGKC
jgi:Na+/H+-dicarboxylate symporter